MNELAQRAVACRHWRWLPGMRLVGHYGARYPIRLCDFGERVFDTMDVEDGGEWWQQPGGKDEMDGGPYPGPYLPDLTDPATLGCLLALVREAYDDELAHVRPCAGGWDFYTLDPMAARVTAPTEAAALVAALEAAP